MDACLLYIYFIWRKKVKREERHNVPYVCTKGRETGIGFRGTQSTVNGRGEVGGGQWYICRYAYYNLVHMYTTERGSF